MASELDVKKATVLGGGSFGTAVANILAENGFQVNLWNWYKIKFLHNNPPPKNQKNRDSGKFQVPSWR
jgi:glycerol-3-phosphate dehydrogenase